MREWRRWPAGWLEEILEARAYAEAKALYDSATTGDAQKRLPRGALMDLVKEIDFFLEKERRDATDE